MYCITRTSQLPVNHSTPHISPSLRDEEEPLLKLHHQGTGGTRENFDFRLFFTFNDNSLRILRYYDARCIWSMYGSKIANQLVTVLCKFIQNDVRKFRHCFGKFRFGWIAAPTRNEYSYKVPRLSRVHLQCPPIMFLRCHVVHGNAYPNIMIP